MLSKASGAYGSQSFAYDPNGDRLTKTVNGKVDTYAYLTGHKRLTGITGQNPDTITYDANGSITAQGNKALTYDQNQRLTRVVVGGYLQTDYVLNGKNQRIIKATDNDVTVYHYDQEGPLIDETEASGALSKEYIWLGYELVAVADAGGLYHAPSSHRLKPRKVFYFNPP
ncbi:MAG: hypothetical protein KQJ78_13110 [Deltaproteobacteria bacterium]|nr:hypothetical protein [Deltaproteobacteria bacterium]